MVAQLQPYIVTSWHGHRNDVEIPSAVKTVWRQKFQPSRRGLPQKQSNVDIALLDSNGRLVHSFDAAHNEEYGRRGAIEQHTNRQLQYAAPLLGLGRRSGQLRPLKLPALNGKRGIRLLVSLADERMKAYQAPVVEVVPLKDSDLQHLAWPDKERIVPATALKPWLSQIYPPGVMERTDPQTKFVYTIKSTTGQLKLTPTSPANGTRRAILSGVVRLTDEGPGNFSYQGVIGAVITYPKNDSKPQSLRGYFDGLYPRTDRLHRDTRWLSLQAAFESIPE
ncbi:MAG: hypothetical protein VYD34_01110 [Verrucomicrobiota bacterium]|nr:hypothetical protein [Verrucomicrobiota bacterium]